MEGFRPDSIEVPTDPVAQRSPGQNLASEPAFARCLTAWLALLLWLEAAKLTKLLPEC